MAKTACKVPGTFSGTCKFPRSKGLLETAKMEARLHTIFDSGSLGLLVPQTTSETNLNPLAMKTLSSYTQILSTYFCEQMRRVWRYCIESIRRVSTIVGFHVWRGDESHTLLPIHQLILRTLLEFSFFMATLLIQVSSSPVWLTWRASQLASFFPPRPLPCIPHLASIVININQTLDSKSSLGFSSFIE